VLILVYPIFITVLKELPIANMLPPHKIGLGFHNHLLQNIKQNKRLPTNHPTRHPIANAAPKNRHAQSLVRFSYRCQCQSVTKAQASHMAKILR